MAPKAELLFYNANVLTMDPSRPRAGAVAVGGGRILAVGSLRDAGDVSGPRTRRVDCQGMTLIPGIHDAHCHFFALSSRMGRTDCGPENAPSIEVMVRRIKRAAEGTPQGRWVRAYGYDDRSLVEKRHPTAADLDRALPRRPVRLDHRSGHASVLNTAAMALLGIDRDTVDPPDGIIDRDAGGRPTGLFFEMSRDLRRRMAPFARRDEFLANVAKANKLLLSRGVTAIQDAGPHNGEEQWRTFAEMKGSGRLTPRVTMMTGPDRSWAADLQNEVPGPLADGLQIGATKFMLTLTTGSLHPPKEELVTSARVLHRLGRQMAFHAVEAEAVAAAARVISQAAAAGPGPALRHRIEHCSEAPPEVLRAVRRSGAMVVTQPGFVHYNGGRYLDSVAAGLIPHLYPLAALDEAGIPWAASTDAPVAPMDPMTSISAAVTRAASDGRPVSPQHRVTVHRALRAHTLDAAHACHQERTLGSLTPGKLADLVLLDQDPTGAPPEGIRGIKTQITVVAGRVVWER